MLRVALIATCLLGLAVQGQGNSPIPGKSVALLIGTDSYTAREWPRLSSPVLDAGTLAKTLAADFSFDTAVVRNATKDEIVRAIVNHGKRATGADDWSLVFLAAHGYFDDDRSQGYLAFRDSRPRADDVARSSYLSLTELRAIVEGFQAGHVLLVIDACYAGTIDPDIRFGTDRAERVAGTTRRDVESSLMRRAQYRSRMYLTSGGKEYVPDGRPGAHSPFAGALLGVLRKASNDGQPLTFSQIVAHMAEVGVEPIPRHNTFRGHEPGGDFLLVPRSFATAWTGAPASRAADTRSPERPSRGETKAPAPTSALGSGTAASSARLFLRLESDDLRATPRNVAGINEAVLTHVASALREQGFGNVAVADATKKPATADCVSAATPCVDVSIRVASTQSNGRQNALVALNATARSTGQIIAAATGRAGPYALDVPADRVATRAADQAIESLVRQLTSALAGRGS